ncbi:hypothetical protein FF124_00755 [Martelella lutilitoris]|uniref:Uncharacterized protein n=1 Tax=Martelella lutilitoris TaxID=2583532 RepID=A0A5C4JW89_9HYPH|nr:hypothetical protein [Martelella lutilitoris]TNB49524.1 hypothetical protein FF124_00755 [Martelella lutilitoris]
MSVKSSPGSERFGHTLRFSEYPAASHGPDIACAMPLESSETMPVPHFAAKVIGLPVCRPIALDVSRRVGAAA